MVWRIVVTITLLSPSVCGQGWTRTRNPFTVQGFESSLDAFAGGIYTPKTEIVDIDGDGDQDILIIQVDGRLTLFENNGGYRWTTDDFLSLNVGQWARFVDIDDDGDLDLFTNRNGAFVAYHENTGTTANAEFVLRDTMLSDSTGQAILSENQSIPEFSDIDNDGDFDLFTGRSIGSLALYENRGTPISPRFTFVTDHFQGLLIISSKQASLERHGASSIRFHDQDGDGDLDLFWGDFFSTAMFLLKNDGTPELPKFDSIFSRSFPSGMVSLGYNAPSFCDLSGDGVSDLLVSVLFREQDVNNLWFFERKNDLYQFRTMNFLPQLDFGRYSASSFADLNGDGLEDLVVGNYSRGLMAFKNTGTQGAWHFESWSPGSWVIPDSFITKPAFGDLDGDGDLDCVVGSFSGRLALLENGGSPFDPIFQLSESFLGGIDVGNYSAPLLVDLDSDSDLDLVVGDGEAHIRIFLNKGDAHGFAFTPGADIALSVPGDLEAVPECVDADKDGDIDLVVGSQSGRLSFFENAGDSLTPNFQLLSMNYGGLKTTQNAAPKLVDWDADGDLDLLLGNVRGGFEAYQAGPQLPLLEHVSSWQAKVAKPFTYRIRSTGNPVPKYELISFPQGMVIDSISGVLRWMPSKPGGYVVVARAYNAVGADTVSFEVNVMENQRVILRQNRPNPASHSTVFPFNLESPMRIRLIIYNVLGQKVKELATEVLGAGSHTVEWDLRNDKGRRVSAGAYFAVLLAGRETVVRKLTVLRDRQE